jgi:hypothetical protein
VQRHTGLFITGNGRPIRWRRDPYDVFLYHLDVPADVHSIEIRSDFIASDPPGEGGGSTSDRITVLSWNAVLLYPYADAGAGVSDIQVQPAVTLPRCGATPAHWKPHARRRTAASHSAPPRSIAWWIRRSSPAAISAKSPWRPMSRPHYLDIVADTPADLDIPPPASNSYPGW